MKKVLLTTTALMMLGGVATAGSSSMSGSISLTYGAWGTGTSPGGTDDWTSEADLDVAASSDSGSISMSGTLEIDEGATAAGPVTISTGGFTLVYDANAIGALALAPTSGAGVQLDGEDDDYGDFSLSYTAGALSATYVGDQATDDSSLAVSYAAGALTLSMTLLDETDGANGTTGASGVNAAGGAGLSSSITGSAVTRAGGGGGGRDSYFNAGVHLEVQVAVVQEEIMILVQMVQETLAVVVVVALLIV